MSQRWSDGLQTEAHEHRGAWCSTPVFDWWSFPGVPPYCRLEGVARAAQVCIQTILGSIAIWISTSSKSQAVECEYQTQYVFVFGVTALSAVVLQVSFGLALHLLRKPKAVAALQTGLGFGPPTQSQLKTTRFELWAQYMCCVVTPCLFMPAMIIRAVVGTIRATNPGFSSCEHHDEGLYISYFVVAAILFLAATNVFGLCLAFTICYRRLNRGMRQRDKQMYGGGLEDGDMEDDDEEHDEQHLLTPEAIGLDDDIYSAVEEEQVQVDEDSDDVFVSVESVGIDHELQTAAAAMTSPENVVNENDADDDIETVSGNNTELTSNNVQTT